jgi:hypothetical protein
MSPKLTDLVAIVRLNPAGLTTRQIADRLAGDANSLSGKLSKLAAYGQISKSAPDGHGKRGLWKPKGSPPCSP